MELILKNLAQVEEAIIEDATLSVFIGDNGTGKTLILEALSLIKSSYIESIDEIIENLTEKFSRFIKIETNWERIEYLQNQLFSQDLRYEYTDEKITINLFIENSDEINKEFTKKLKKLEEEIIKKVNNEVLFENTTNFKFELYDFPKIESHQYNMDMLLNTNDDLIGTVYIDKSENSYEHIILTRSRLPYSSIVKRKMFKLDSENEILNIKQRVEEMIKAQLLSIPYRQYLKSGKLLFLPSERNTFMNTALRKASINISSNRITQRYSERMFDSAYLEYKDVLELLPEMIKKNAKRKDLIQLFDGEIVYSKDNEIEAIKKENGVLIKRELFSTKQNRLVPFLLIHNYLENYRQIIIEEPEAHLSIKSIKQFLAYITNLIEEDKSFYLTTHSDVFFTHLNNFLLKNNELSVNIYELKTYGQKTKLEKKTKNEFGYTIDLFSDELTELYDETLSIQERKEEDC